MARGIYFSGDLAAINDAMASEEANRIRGRSANQSFLANLAQQATQRRGQDVEERMGRARNQAIFDTESLRAGTADRATSAQLEAARLQSGSQLDAAKLQNARELERIKVDAERIAALEREGIRVDAREKMKLEQAAKEAIEGRKQIRIITAIQAMTGSGRLAQDPRLAGDVLNANLGIQERNQQAMAAAEMANAGLLESEKSIFKPKAFEAPNMAEAQAYLRGLPPEQGSLLSITNDANGVRYVPRLTPPVSTPQPPQVDMNAILRLLGVEGLPVPPSVPHAPAAPSPARAPSQVIPISSITRSGGTNPPPSWNQPSVATPPFVQRQQSTNALAAALESQPAAPSALDVLQSLDQSQYQRPQWPSGPGLLGGDPKEFTDNLIAYLDEARAITPQGPPQRVVLRGERVPWGLTASPDFNRAGGSYFDPAGRYFRVPYSTRGEY